MRDLVGRRPGAVVGRHQRAVAQPVRSRDRRATRRCRCRRRSAASRSASAAASSSRCATASGLPTRRAARAQGRRCALRSRAPSLQRRPLRPAGALLRRHDEREPRREHRGAVPARSPISSFREVFDDMMISNGLAWSPDGRTMYHADTPTQIVHAYDYDTRTGTPSRKRARSSRWTRGRRPARRRVRRQRRLLLERVLPRRQGRSRLAGGTDARRVSAARDVPDDVRARRPGPAHAVRDERAAAARRDDELARLPQSGGIFAMRVDVPGLARAALRGLTAA